MTPALIQIFIDREIDWQQKSSYLLPSNKLTFNPWGHRLWGFYLKCLWLCSLYLLIFLFPCSLNLSPSKPLYPSFCRLNPFSYLTSLLIHHASLLPPPSFLSFLHSLILLSFFVLTSLWICIFLSVYSPRSGCPDPWPCVRQFQPHSWWLHAAYQRCGTSNKKTFMSINPKVTALIWMWLLRSSQ